MKRLLAIKYHGGKYYLAPQLVRLMPAHLHYVEPYAGGLAVLLAKRPDYDWAMGVCPECREYKDVCGHWPPDAVSLPSGRAGCSEVVNDIDGDLTQFWRVLASPLFFPQFQLLAELTAFSEDVWNEAKRRLDLDQSPVNRAFWFFVQVRMSRQALGRSFATLSKSRTRGGINEQAAAWLSAVELLPEIHARLRSVVVLCRPAVEVIAAEQSPDTFFYCDPPYVPATRSSPRAYRHEMTQYDHVQLLDVLGATTAKFMLSGYSCDLYDAAADRYGWTRYDFEVPNNASGSKTKQRKIESVWLNY